MANQPTQAPLSPGPTVSISQSAPSGTVSLIAGWMTVDNPPLRCVLLDVAAARGRQGSFLLTVGGHMLNLREWSMCGSSRYLLQDEGHEDLTEPRIHNRVPPVRLAPDHSM
jgi:hypothetical protein